MHVIRKDLVETFHNSSDKMVIVSTSGVLNSLNGFRCVGHGPTDRTLGLD